MLQTVTMASPAPEHVPHDSAVSGFVTQFENTIASTELQSVLRGMLQQHEQEWIGIPDGPRGYYSFHMRYDPKQQCYGFHVTLDKGDFERGFSMRLGSASSAGFVALMKQYDAGRSDMSPDNSRFVEHRIKSQRFNERDKGAALLQTAFASQGIHIPERMARTLFRVMAVETRHAKAMER